MYTFANTHGSCKFPILSLSGEFQFSFASSVYWEQTGSLVVCRLLDHKQPHLDLINRAAQNPEILDFEWDAIIMGEGVGSTYSKRRVHG